MNYKNNLDIGELWNGGARRDRTADLYNAIVALSQLSYGPRSCRPALIGPAIDGAILTFPDTTS